MKNFKRFGLFVSLLSCIPITLYADIVQLTVVPSSWKLENYLNSNVVVWNSGSSCTNGKITFPSTATIDDKRFFWSTVMAAKVSKQQIFVRYNNSTTSCHIVSFGLPQE